MLILVVAGDPSGDLHGSHFIAALKRQAPRARVAAVGGPLMRAQADEFLEDLAGRGVTGFLEPALKIRFLLDLGLRLKRFLAERKPSLVVCIDYYGFNRRVLGLAKQASVPAVYYVSPQVWASRPGRVAVLKRLARKMLVIFPFEETLYRKAGVPCQFVGHPLLDLLPSALPAVPVDGPLRVGLLPGSRRSEVARHLPVFAAAFQRLKRHYPDARGCVFASPSLPDSAYAAAGLEIVREQDYARRRELHLAFCSSGTATLENALLGVPMVVVYKMSWPTYLIARAIIRVKNIAMANIIAGKTLVPELIQGQARPDKIAAAAVRLLEDPRRYVALRRELSGLREALGSGGAAERAAKAALAEIVKGVPA